MKHKNIKRGILQLIVNAYFTVQMVYGVLVVVLTFFGGETLCEMILLGYLISMIRGEGHADCTLALVLLYSRCI